MPDLSSPAELSLPQAILLEHAKDLDAISDLIANADKPQITEHTDELHQVEVTASAIQKTSTDIDIRPLN